MVNSVTRQFFESQIERNYYCCSELLSSKNVKAVLTSTLLSNIDNASLYSMNSAKIDYIPYQFRPILKMIKSDSPRILIADGVGVGKTIEAGLIIKELQARMDIKSILIICPKPLITENKWASEMDRFDCKFINLDGKTLKHCLDEYNKDDIWPETFNKCVIPFSLFDEELVFGLNNSKKKTTCLMDLNPFPKFDLVIVDEAHHIRNSQTNRYKGVKMFLDNCDSAILLTATPLQMGDNDLYILLNLLRPDLILDYDTFQNMAKPNHFISKASTIIRHNIDNWQMEALKCLENARTTPFGSAIYNINPNYSDSIKLLHKGNISSEERVSLIEKVESLHTFSKIINRTRRRDIGAFTIRKIESLLSNFTGQERVLYEKFLTLVAQILIAKHGNKCIKFMMTTLLRQASSSLHALAPFMKDIINKKYEQLDYFDFEENEDYESTIDSVLGANLNESTLSEIIELSEYLPQKDEKVEFLLDIVRQKSQMENNKVMVFSAFKHTLNYLHKTLSGNNIRAAIIHGGVPDEERVLLRNRFMLNKSDVKAIDVLLFSDVGCEGLDYQFCDCLVNYDIPWNPQKIEQRIGRIDRKGQNSESVLIYNMVVKDTIDEDIYSRCLLRIDVFNSQIGDSEEIIGNITKDINDIALKYILNPEESKQRLKQLSDNIIRELLEKQKLEESQYSFFGLEVANNKIDKEVEYARNVFLSKDAIINLVEAYFEKLKIEKAVIKNNEGYFLKINKEDKEKLYNDFMKLDKVRDKLYYGWESYLKSDELLLNVSFDGEYVNNSLFISSYHPLIKQAVFNYSENRKCSLKIKTDKILEGKYIFEIYLWSYNGLNKNNKIKVVTDIEIDDSQFLEIIFNSEDGNELFVSSDMLEKKHFKMWQEEKDRYLREVVSGTEYRKQTLKNSFNKRIKIINDSLMKVEDEKIIRMKKSEINNCMLKMENKLKQLDETLKMIDILSTKLISGILVVEN